MIHRGLLLCTPYDVLRVPSYSSLKFRHVRSVGWYSSRKRRCAEAGRISACGRLPIEVGLIIQSEMLLLGRVDDGGNKLSVPGERGVD